MVLKFRFLLLLLIVMMVFTSCSLDSILGYIVDLDSNIVNNITTQTDKIIENPIEDFVYDDIYTFSVTKEELEARYTLTPEDIDNSKAILYEMVELSKTTDNVEKIEELSIEFENAYYHIVQQTTISMIIYYYDMVDEIGKTRYVETLDMYYDVYNTYNDCLKLMYLESPVADQIFIEWSKEDLEALREYDPILVELEKEIEALQVQYNQLSDYDPDYNNKCVEIYKQLIITGNKLARLKKYDNYYEYASAKVYERDYETKDLEAFHQYVAQYVVPVYDNVIVNATSYQNWMSDEKKYILNQYLNYPFYSSEINYVNDYFSSLQGKMGESMRDMFDGKNCLFSYEENSHPTAFQTYLYKDDTPFCFFGSNGQTARTIIHEVGHYYAAKSNPTIESYDLCETHSQGNEFLFLSYNKQNLDGEIFNVARAAQLRRTGFVMIIATIVDEFEQRLYVLDDETILSMTSEDFDNIMTDVCERYGGAQWVRTTVSNPYSYWRLVCISNPVYYISYAVSATAAVNILALAEDDYDAAVAAYTILVEGVTYEDGFLGALQKAGLTTPFEEETFIKIGEVFSK